MNAKSDEIASLQQTVELITSLIAHMEAYTFQQDGFSDLTLRQVLYMETISRLGHPSFGELAEALGIKRPSVTALVGKLIRLGYVQKAQDDEDRRSFHIIPTPKGEQFTHIHQKIHERVVQLLTDRLSEDEITQLAALMNKAVGR